MKLSTARSSKNRSIFPVGILVLGLATVGLAQHANAANAYATTSVDADQAALVFDATFSSHSKTGRSAAAASSTSVGKLWTNTVDRNFYGQ